jgi:hypothetical protein
MLNNQNKKVFERLINGFRELKQDPEYIIKNYKPIMTCSFNKNCSLLSHSHHCVCGQYIVENCHIIDSLNKNKEEFIVGNCCVYNFFENNIIDCLNCKKKTDYKSKMSNYCKKCTKNICLSCGIFEDKIKDDINRRCSKCKIGYCCKCPNKKIKISNYTSCYDCNMKNKKNNCKICGKLYNNNEGKYISCWECKKNNN